MNIKSLSKCLSANTSTAVALGILASSVALPEAALAANPIVSHVYTADPAARVFNGRVYVVTTHDQDSQTDYSQLVDYYLFSSDDMVNWQDHGIIWNSKTNTNWANLAYAPDFIERNGKYYLYFPDGGGSIGVAVADNPEGPYIDPLGHALVDSNTPNGSVQWIFDPGVFIDDDGQAYLYFGGGGQGNARVIKLNNDMISTSGSAISIDVPNFFEALYMHKRNGTYYLSYSSDTSSGMKIEYMTSNNPTTGFTYRGTVLSNPWENNSNNNHASIVDYKDKSYIFYHNRIVANERGASTFQRSVNVDSLEYNTDGTIKEVNAGRAGVPQLKTVNAFNQNQAEIFDQESGIETENATDGTLNVIMGTGDWIKVSGVNFGSGAQQLKLRTATDTGSSLEVILDSLNNSPVATIDIDDSGGWQTWQTQSTALNTTISGVHDVYLRANGWHNLNWYQFIGSGGNAGSSTLAVELESLSGQSSFSPLSVKSDSGASNGQYIEWSNDGSNQSLSSPSNTASGQVAINFSVSQTTNVSFEIQASLAGGYDDSFYYQLDSGSWITQNNIATTGWGNVTLQTFNNVAAGEHVLRILRREDGAKLDKVTLSASNGNLSLTADNSDGNGGSDGDDYQVPNNNFADNGGAEGSLKNWSTTAGSISLSNTQSHSGSSSVLITGRTADWHGIIFNAGSLVNGNEYDVAVWVKLAAGSADVPVTLTAKRQDDSDSSTYNEYEQVATAVASANRWTLLQGFYTQSGTPFEHFIVESENETVSFYADDFSIGGDAGGVGNYKYVGNITTRGAVRSDFVQYWDQITPENEGKWGSVERQRDVYNWSGVDAAYNYAKQNNILFKQHTFVWGSQYPTWIDSLSPSEQAAEIEEWIRDFCIRYPDVDQIDVVNEATPGHAPANYAKSAFGNDWIIKSFQLARQYCPNAELILNDYNVLSWNTDEFIAMAIPAINAGVVDAIGLQSHGLADRPYADVESKLNRIAALGLPIYISEYDIEKTNDQEQLNVMKSQFPLFYNHPSVKGITLWGYVVGTTWRDGTGLIQSNGTQRPAMTWLMNYLEQQRGSNNGGDDNGGGNQTCELKSNNNWTSTGPLISPQRSNWASIKDPTVVKYNNKYHVFATVFDTAKDNWGGVYLNFSDWSQAGSATQVNMSTTPAGNTVAPQVFFFEPENKWYMIYQWGAKYSTNTDISNPAGWTTPQPLLSNGLSNGIDYWVICDDNYCHLFFSGDDGKLYRSKVPIGNFPNFSGYEVVMQDTVAKLFEASNVYKVEGTDKYLLLVEAYAPRYFRSWTSTSLDGPWTPLADTKSNPFAGAANVSFPGGKWTDDISHGEMIRSGYDQTLKINACNMQYLYQGQDPNSGEPDYNRLPYKLGLISAN